MAESAMLSTPNFDQADFVTSDHHFGHARIIELAERPFASLGAMHGELIAAWNRVVGPNDVVLHLGNLALGNREESIGITSALNGKKLGSSESGRSEARIGLVGDPRLGWVTGAVDLEDVGRSY